MTNFYKLYLPAVLLSCLISACSSSGSGTPATDDGEAASVGAGDAAGTETTGGTDNTAGDNSNAETIAAGDSGIAGAAAVAILQGDWATECMLEADNDPALYLQQTLSVDGANLVAELGWFSDPDCSVSQAVGILVNGSTKQANGVTVPTGATVNTTLGAAEAVDLHLGVPTIDNEPVSDELLGLPGFEEEVIFDIALIFEGKLYFGDIESSLENDGSSAQARPIALDFINVYSRVP